jgi:uncharacterized protein YdeI (YjbR/CyaY-like superfamily)
MSKFVPEIDAYIAKSADFAKPILIHFRALVHKACPDVQEKIKWGMPHFDYQNAPMCHMAAFKQHCSIGFWKAALMKDAELLMAVAKSEAAMGHLGKITGLKSLPTNKVLTAYIKDAMQLNEKGIKLAAKKIAAGTALPEMPADFEKALKKTKAAKHNYDKFSPGHKREYLNWILEAKTEATRAKRIATACEWLNNGKIRNWKYAK